MAAAGAAHMKFAQMHRVIACSNVTQITTGIRHTSDEDPHLMMHSSALPAKRN
jgi:hypothetical protein